MLYNKYLNGRFAIVIPVYREIDNLRWLIPEILQTYKNCYIIVVNDFSNDGTESFIKDIRNTGLENKIHLIERIDTPSYATSLLIGLKFALNEGFEKVIQMDADGSHAIWEIGGLLNSVADLTIASRYLRGSKVIGVPLFRKLISRLSNIFLMIKSKSKVRDQTNGFRAFGPRALLLLKDFDSLELGFAVQISILNHLRIHGLSIEERPTIFKYREIGSSKFDKQKLLEAFAIALKLTRK